MSLLRPSICLLALAAAPAYAGRPLTVDDAGVDDIGTGHVEAWYARQPGRAHTWTIAPAYSPIEGVELNASVARDRTNERTTSQLGIKFLITPSREEGCNTGVALAAAHTRGTGNSPSIVGLATCNGSWGSAHLNLGGTRNPGAPTFATWGLAFEKALGLVTAHVEAFGQRHAKPTVQIGARFHLTPSLQLDGTVGRSAGETLLSVGVQLPF